MVKKKNRRGIREQAPDAPADVKRSGISLRQLPTPEPEPEVGPDPEGDHDPFTRHVLSDAVLHIDPGSGDYGITWAGVERSPLVSIRANQQPLLDLSDSLDSFRQALRVRPGILSDLVLGAGEMPSLREELEQMAQRAATRSTRQILEESRRTTTRDLQRAIYAQWRGYETEDPGLGDATRQTEGLERQRGYTAFMGSFRRRMEELHSGRITRLALHADTTDLGFDNYSSQRSRMRTGRSSMEVDFNLGGNSVHDLPSCATALVAMRMLDSPARVVDAVVNDMQGARLRNVEIIIAGEAYVFVHAEGDSQCMYCFDAHSNLVRRFRQRDFHSQTRFGSKASMFIALSRMDAFR